MDERTTAALVGRPGELATLQRFVDGLAHARPAADAVRILVIEGPPGIGKTLLWLAGADLAAERGIRVLRARPAETEAGFAYAALGDLLRDVWPEVRAALPRQQLETLSVALGLADTPASTIEAAVVQAATLNVLLSLAADRPLLLAIDDAPWMDGPSAAAVQFAARRAGNRPIGFLVAQRGEAEGTVPFDLDRSFPDQPVDRLWLEPLSIGALHKLLDDRLGMTLPRPQLLRLHELSGGVPLHALEIARALRHLPPIPAGAPLPIPLSIRELLRARTGRLRPAEREAVLLVAAAGSLPLATLGAAVDGGVGAVSAAIDDGLLSIDGETIRPGHPLIASTIYESASAAARRATHARLADVTDEPEARARHRALATHGADEEVAAELEAAGDRTIDRGAPERAAELHRLAVDRTPAADSAARDRRSLRLAEALYRAADLLASGAILDDLVPRLAPGELLARALIIRCEVGWYTRTGHEAVADAEAAIVAAGDDPRLRAEGHFRLSIFYDFDQPRAHANARAAVALLEHLDEPGLLASALMVEFGSGVALGEPPRLELLERALALEPDDTPHSTTIPGIWLTALDRLDEARRRFEWILELDRRHGLLSSEANILTRLAEVEIWADRYDAARELADAATAAARQQGDDLADPARRVRALVDAHTGRLDEARAAAEEAAGRTEERGDHIIAAAWLVVLACVASTRGDHAEVDAIARRSAASLATIGMVEPLRLAVDHEWPEALVGLGRFDEAEAVLGAVAERQARIPRPWLQAALVRGRALLRLAGDDVAGALAEAAKVDGPEAATWRRLDRARTLLVRGSILRRARSPRDAGAALDEAAAIFRAIGAHGWLDRATAEIDRLGRRRLGTEALTPSEQQVAELAANGMTNREVADRLSLSPKTVEAHLARAYAKLGIRSRAELGRLMAGRSND